MIPNTDLLRAVSKYDASGRPRFDQFPDHWGPAVKKFRDQRRGLASLFQIIFCGLSLNKHLEKPTIDRDKMRFPYSPSKVKMVLSPR